MCRPQSVIKQMSETTFFLTPRLLPSPLPCFSLGSVRISNGDEVAEEETCSLLLARTEEPHHSAPQAILRSFISSEPLGVQRNLFFQALICPLWSVMLVCIAWRHTSEPLCSAFHFMRLLFFYRRDEKKLVRDVLGEAEKLLGKISMDQSVLIFSGSWISYLLL